MQLFVVAYILYFVSLTFKIVLIPFKALNLVFTNNKLYKLCFRKTRTKLEINFNLYLPKKSSSRTIWHVAYFNVFMLFLFFFIHLLYKKLKQITEIYFSVMYQSARKTVIWTQFFCLKVRIQQLVLTQK